MSRFAFCIALLIVAAWAAQKTEYELYYAPPCVKEVHMTSTTSCHGPDRNHLLCGHIGMSLNDTCAVLRPIHASE